MKPEILYDPIYNFHSGFHREVILSTAQDINWKQGKVVNIFESCIWNSEGVKTSHSLINFGYFPQADHQLVFSPHILLGNKNNYIMELESIRWLFADTYFDASQPIPRWKLKVFEQYISSDNLRQIVWWTQTAKNDFFENFLNQYQIHPYVIERVQGISTVIYPSSLQVQREVRNTESNDFVLVVGKGQFYRKGIDVALKSFEMLQEEGVSNWRLHLIGSEDGIQTKIDSEKIIPYGQISPEELSLIFAKYPFFLFLSRGDTLGTSVIQAINSNAYIISTAGEMVSGTKEVLGGYPNKQMIENLPGKDGLDKLDCDPIFEVLRHLIKNPQNIEPYHTKKYSRERMKKQILELVGPVQSEKRI